MSLINDLALANDANNSSTQNLLAGAYFTGKPSSAPYGGVITVFLCTDQLCYVFFEQSADGTNWDHQLIFTPDADRFKEGFGGKGDTESWSIRSLALYYRIRVQNPTASATTYFRLATRLQTQGSGGVATLVDDDGHPIESMEAATGQFHLGVSTVQSVLADANNSYNGILTGGGTYVGTCASTLGVAGLQVMLRTDQNCILYVDQSGNSGTNWDITDTYTYLWSKGGQSWTTQAVGDAFRVRLVNQASAATTYTRLATALCPIVEAVPRALSPNGNFQVDIMEMLDTFGTGVLATPQGQLRIADNVRLVGAQFDDSAVLDTNFWGSTAVGSGTIVPGGSQVILRTGALVNSAGTIQSVRRGRYIGGISNYFRSTSRFPAVTGANRRRLGAYDAANGFFFEHDGTTLSVVTRKGGVDTRVASGSFNGDLGNTYVLDDNPHAFEIYWSNKSTWFTLDTIILHKFSGASPLSNTNNLSASAEVANLAGNTNANSLEVRAATINRLGMLSSETTYKYIAGAATTICKFSGGRLIRVIINNPDAAAQNITVYDSTGGTTNQIAALGVPNLNNVGVPVSIEFGCPFFNGLTVVTDNAAPVTIIYE